MEECDGGLWMGEGEGVVGQPHLFYCLAHIHGPVRGHINRRYP
jgi:hypothetical protein